MSPNPFVSRAKAPLAKRSLKGYGGENAFIIRLNLLGLNILVHPGFLIVTVIVVVVVLITYFIGIY